MILKSIQSTRKRKKFFAQTHHVNQHISLKAKKKKKKKERNITTRLLKEKCATFC